MRLAFQVHPAGLHRRNFEIVSLLRDGFSPDEVVWRHGPPDPEVDGAIIYGIAGAREVFTAYRAQGKPVVILDKGYVRPGYLRVSINANQPVEFFNRDYPSDRFERLLSKGLRLKPYRTGTHILFNGASYKYCRWAGLDWETWGPETVRKLCGFGFPVIYRPRPDQYGIKPVEGAELSSGPLAHDLARTRVAVSHGGNLGWDCAVGGVPHFAIADSVSRPISETDWSKLAQPKIPTEEERFRWGSAVACWQWTRDEIRSGAMWKFIRPYLHN